MKIREVALEKLKPYAGNPRIIDRAVSRVARSIQEFGFNQPIVVDKDFVVVVGHARLEAAKSLGLKTAPVVVAEHLTEGQARAYRLADNKTSEFAQWDEAKLLDELRSLSEFGALEITGFTDSEMLALEMQAKALLEASTPAPSPAPATSLARQEPLPATPTDEQSGLVGDFGDTEQDDDRDDAGDVLNEERPAQPQLAMVRIELIVDEEQRRAIMIALNQAKTKYGVETLGSALHVMSLEWMEANK